MSGGETVTDETKEVPAQERAPDESSADDERREFLTKVASAAGALAAAGLIAGASGGEAEAQPRVQREISPEVTTEVELIRETPLQYQRIGGTHVVRLQGPEIAKILAREGLIPEADANKADVGIAIRIGSQLAKP
jgi:hypothetical protein